MTSAQGSSIGFNPIAALVVELRSAGCSLAQIEQDLRFPSF